LHLHMRTLFTSARYSDKESEALALAVLCLRQFYLGCSKIRTWECLRRRIFGDRYFCVTNFYTFNAHGRFLHSSVGSTEGSLGHILSWGLSYAVAVC
jgi:hypothetical protein